MSVQNNIFIGEVFQIKVSDGRVHFCGKKLNLYTAFVIAGAPSFRSLDVLKVPNDPPNECTKYHFHW